jgi:DNA-binding transcriptional MerR regulator
MQIGRVSEQPARSVDAIRLVEKQQLLNGPPPAGRRFRLFNPEDMQTLQYTW